MRKPSLGNIILPTTFAILIVILWSAVVSMSQKIVWIVPSPLSVLRVFFTHTNLLYHHTVTTVIETLVGLTLSIILGSLVAIAMDCWESFRKTIYPFVVVSQTIPILAMAPLFVLWFGYGITAKIFIVTLVCFFPITVNFYDGLRLVSVDYLRLLKSMNASSWQTFYLLKLPSSLPSFFTGLKLAVSYSVMAAVIGEWLGGISGLGIYMTRATRSYQTAHVFAIIVLISALSLILYGGVLILERFLLKWKFGHLEEYIDSGKF